MFKRRRRRRNETSKVEHDVSHREGIWNEEVSGRDETEEPLGRGHSRELQDVDADDDRLMRNKKSRRELDVGGPDSKDSASTRVASHSFASTKTAKPAEYGGSAVASSEILNAEPPKSKKGKYGPMRAPSNLRTTVRFDYQPEICKDYKETGYCGYGDNCKFIHDRGDYKTGWELEKEWAAKKSSAALLKKPSEATTSGTTASMAATNTEPALCKVCGGPFTPPVVTTLCGHKFCQKCAFSAYAESTRCQVCGKQTNGVFNIVNE